MNGISSLQVIQFLQVYESLTGATIIDMYYHADIITHNTSFDAQLVAEGSWQWLKEVGDFFVEASGTELTRTTNFSITVMYTLEL